MSNIAILVGNVNYQNLHKLECCHEDIMAMDGLLRATGKYDEIAVFEDLDADGLKSSMRAVVDKYCDLNELFFYFTGHGGTSSGEFFHCATNFDSRRPNETGLSISELHILLRMGNANLVVKVIDACHSGTMLVKSEESLANITKEAFKNVIQISSSLESQSSLIGSPLSLFTEKFQRAALRKTDGIVYYSDIINSLRDEFLDNEAQTPFFVSQVTGREKFVDDASLLNELREKVQKEDHQIVSQDSEDGSSHMPISNILERLRAAEAKVATPDLLNRFIERFFYALEKRVRTEDFVDFFDISLTAHNDYSDDATKRSMIRVLSKIQRPDNFVTAKYSRTLRRRSALALAAIYQDPYSDEDSYKEEWDLFLNCRMQCAQVKVIFTPKFSNLMQIIMVVSCAPSLERCYIFESLNQHMLCDFGKFEPCGKEISSRWWKLNWDEPADGVVEQLSSKILDAVQTQIEEAESRLSEL